ncbi:MAG: DUF4365 domain-containing protein, partial [Bacteroidota bacterium]
MTEDHIKEQLSLQYIGVLASRLGYRTDRPFTDYGVDLMIERIERVQKGNQVRYFSSGQSVDVQLKCTTEQQIIRKDQRVIYDLKVKNYNDLILRKQATTKGLGSYIPLLLIVVILPGSPEKWVKMKTNGNLLIRGSAYWFYPGETMTLSENKS